MRLSKLAAYGASIVISVALLAGCASTSTGTSAVPGASGSGVGSMAKSAHMHFQPPKSALDLLKMQVAGKMRGPTSHKLLAKYLRDWESGKNKFTPKHIKRPTAPGLWTDDAYAESDNYDGYILGFATNGKTYDGGFSPGEETNGGCQEPWKMVTDGSGNLFVACQYGYDYSAGIESGNITEFPAGSGSPHSYLFTCPNLPAGWTCEYAYGYPAWVTVDSSGGVYAGYYEYEYEDCGYTSTSEFTCNYDFGDGGIGHWASRTSSMGFYATDSENYGNVCGANEYYYCDPTDIDVDGSGNIYQLASGYNDSYDYSYGVYEIKNAFSSPQVTKIISSSDELTNVYASHLVHGRTNSYTLNVTDSTTGDIDRYALPFTTSEGFTTLGPIPTNYFDERDPCGLGFNAKTSDVLVGDCYSWIDLGKVSANTFKMDAQPYYMTEGMPGVAYVPSDK